MLKKLLHSNVGTYHPEPAIILTDRGEFLVTENEHTERGYKLIPFLDLTGINTRINQMLRGQPLKGIAEVEPVNGVIHISPVANCFRVVNYLPGTAITRIEGQCTSQPIVIMGSGPTLLVQKNSSINLVSNMEFTDRWSTLFIQDHGTHWCELSRSHNT